MDRAEAQKALQACIADEQTYQFTSFSHRDAWELGHALVDACEKMGAPLAVEIEINHVIVFRYYPDGTGAYHEQWLRRKRNLVNLLEKSSQRAYYELEVNCEDQERDWRLPRSDYAACSGAFPIRIRGGTDGARLSFEGLPCPNLCTGGENFHGRFEYIPADDMETITNLLAQLMWQLAE